MAGTLKLGLIQLNDHLTPTNNFTVTTPSAGTLAIKRGNLGVETQTVLQVNADGGVALSAGPAFLAYQSVSQSWPAATTVINFQTIVQNVGSAFDNTTMRFTPQVAGFYMIGGGAYMAGSTTITFSILKNGVNHKTLGAIQTNGVQNSGQALVYMNGTTDYVQLAITPGVGTSGVIGEPNTYFSGYLARAA